MLRQIKISNFRSCRDVSINLSQPLLAFAGRNGVGKTNILHAIQASADLATTADFSEVEGIGLRTGQHVFELGFTCGGQSYRYRIGINQSLSGDTSEELTSEENGVLFVRKGELVSLGHGADILIGSTSSSIAALTSLLPSSNPIVSELARIKEYLTAIQYYPLVDRVRDHDPRPTFVSGSQYQDWAARQQAARLRPDSVAFRLIYLHENDPDRFSELHELLGTDGLGLIDSIRIRQIGINRVEEDAAARTGQGDRSDSAYVLTFVPSEGLGGAGKEFLFSGLSAGTRRMVQIVTYLIFDRANVMLMEQPEDCVHSRLLEKLLGIFESFSAGAQFLFSTHSTHVLDLLRPNQVRLVSSFAGGTRVHELDSSEIDAASKYLVSDGRLSDFLTLVE